MDEFASAWTLPGPNIMSFTEEQLREHLQRIREEIATSVPANQLSPSQVKELLDALPRLTERDIKQLNQQGKLPSPGPLRTYSTFLQQDSVCPICFTSVGAILAEEEVALALDSPAHPVEELGVTRLAQEWQCGHVFCRKDISKWIQEAHNSCPMCRRLLVKTESQSQERSDELDVVFQELDTLMGLLNHPATPFTQHRGNHGGDDDERQGWSGMYS